MLVVEAEVMVVVTTTDLLADDEPADEAEEDAEDAELADEVALGVVKVEMIPLLLIGYYQHCFISWDQTCKRTPVQEGIAGIVEKANI